MKQLPSTRPPEASIHCIDEIKYTIHNKNA